MAEPARGQQPPGLLPINQPPEAQRSANLELIAREADLHTRRGFELAGRSAYFSARAEFVAALRLVAQGLDAEYQTTQHSQALAAGLTAIKEAGDFLPSGSQLEADLDLATIVQGHRTPVLRDAQLDRLTPMAAMQCYFTYAQEQLGAAAGREVAGSMALVGLGKLHRVMADAGPSPLRAARPKAMVFYQAALLACPRNFMASNDLGVLLAGGGRCEDARIALEHSLSVCPQPIGWRNLAVVYRQLGRADLAEKALRQGQIRVASSHGRLAASDGRVIWVDPRSFGPAGDPAPDPNGNGHAPAAPAGSGPFRPIPARPASQGRMGQAAPCTALASRVELCQALGPAAPCNICGVDCSTCDWCRRGGWESARAIAWQAYAQGEYVGPYRLAHVAEYRLRVDDQLDMIYRVTREESPTPYKLNVGDEVRVESFTDPALTRDLMIQPDGTITLRLLGQVHATGRTVAQLRDHLEELYKKYYKVPAITVTPLKVNSKLEDLRATVDRRQGVGGQSQLVRVTPEGTIALPAIGSVPAQGLTLGELQRELNERYREEVQGIEVIPVLAQRAPRFVYVLGEVRTPGRFELTGPTTALQAIGMAGSYNVGANLRQIVVFRRGDDWRLMATMINLQAALLGRQPCPPGEIWLSDSDVVLVPKGPILLADDFIDQVFTRGIYGVFPFQTTLDFGNLSSL